MLAVWFCGSAAYAAVDTPLDLTAVTTDAAGEGWSWDAAKKMLTLNGFVYEDKESGKAAISVPPYTTINVADGTVNTISTNKSVGIYSDSGVLTFAGNGELYINMQGNGSTGIYVNNIGYCLVESSRIDINNVNTGIKLWQGLYEQRGGSVSVCGVNDDYSCGIKVVLGGVILSGGTVDIQTSTYGIYAVFLDMNNGDLFVKHAGNHEKTGEWPSGTTGLNIGRTYMFMDGWEMQTWGKSVIGDINVRQGLIQIEGWENGIVSDGGSYLQSKGDVAIRNSDQFGICIHNGVGDDGIVKISDGNFETHGECGAIIVMLRDADKKEKSIILPDTTQITDGIYDLCWLEEQGTLEEYYPLVGYMNKAWRDADIDKKRYNSEFNLVEMKNEKIFVPEIKVQAAEPVQTTAALPTSSLVLVDGKPVAFEAYNIEGNNYFKLRDLAAAFSGSDKQFSVQWDGEKQAIGLQSNQPYTGKITVNGDAKPKNAVINKAVIYKDGEKVTLQAYNIDGNTYFKLRDIGKLFDFPVNFDAAKNQIAV